MEGLLGCSPGISRFKTRRIKKEQNSLFFSILFYRLLLPQGWKRKYVLAIGSLPLLYAIQQKQKYRVKKVRRKDIEIAATLRLLKPIFVTTVKTISEPNNAVNTFCG